MTYTIEVVRWSNRLQEYVLHRLSYARSWMPDRQLWRDFLVHAEELESPPRSEFDAWEDTLAKAA
jgi:hypothetical protein